VSKPALEDVFIRRTGHKFWSENNSEENFGENSSHENNEKRR
jgi:hypothetical protein